jgi:ABC-2 type transport system permease protein
MLLSGFMVPFRGMPQCAQVLGEVLPLTYFLRIVRAVMLKGAGAADIAPRVWPVIAFIAAAALVALKRYRRTLD